MKSKILGLVFITLISLQGLVRAEAENIAASDKTGTVQDLLNKINREQPDTQNVAQEQVQQVVAAPAPAAVTKIDNITPNIFQQAQVQGNNILSQAKPEQSLPVYKTVLATFFICSLITVIFLFINSSRAKGASVLQSFRNQPLKLVQKLNLGLKSEVALLEYENTRLLISVQANEIKLLQTFDNSPEVPQVEEPQNKVSAQDRISAEFKILEEIQQNKNQLHFDAKEKLSSRVREMVQKLSPLPSSITGLGVKKNNGIQAEVEKKTAQVTA